MAAADNPSKDALLLTQEELDALIAQQLDAAKQGAQAIERIVAATEQPPAPIAPVAEQSDGDFLIAQSELDTLINESGLEDSHTLPPADTPDDEAESAADPDDHLDQASLDALLAEAGAGAPPDEAALDALLADQPASAAAEVSAESSEDPGSADDGGLLDQAALDALLAEVEPSPPKAHRPAPQEPPVPAASAEAADITLSQEHLDNLLRQEGFDPSNEAELDEDLSPDGSDTGMDAPIRPVSESAQRQDDIDALIAEATQGDDLPVPPPRDTVDDEESSQPVEVTEDEIDRLVGAEETDAAGIDEENAAAGGASSEVLLDQAALDALLADAGADSHEGAAEAEPAQPAPEPTSDAVAPPVFEPEKEAAAADEGPPMDPDIAEAINLDELVVHEPATEEPGPEAAGAAVEAPSGQAPPDALGKAARSRTPFRMPSLSFRLPTITLGDPLVFFRQHAIRLATAISTGMVVAMGTFTILLTNQVQQPDPEEIARISQLTLQEAVTLARDYLAEGANMEALSALDEGLARESDSPLASEAAFLRLRALYQALEVQSTQRERIAFNHDVDDFELTYPADMRTAQALEWQARLYEAEGQPYAARRNYRKIEANYPSYDNMPEVLLASARLALAINQPDDALASLQTLVRDFPGAPKAAEAQLLLADTAIARGERRQGRTLLEGLARTHTHTGLGAAAIARLARLAFEEGRFEDAISLLEERRRRATTVDGNDEVYLLLAQAYRDAGDTAEAERVLRELIDFFPDTPLMPQAYLALSDLLERTGRREEALRLARLALNRYSNERDVLLNAAQLLEKAGEPLEAADLFMRANAMQEGEADTLLRAGRAYLAGEEPASAMAALEQVAAAFPGTPESVAAGIEWARAAHRAGESEPAVNRLRSLYDQTLGQPGHVPVLLGLAGIYSEMGLTDQAAQAYREVSALTNEPQRLADAAVAMLRAELFEEGLATARRVDLDAVQPATAYALLMEQGEAMLRADSAQAIALMEQAREDFPAYRTARGDRRLFRSYLATDQPARARIMLDELEQAARRDPLMLETVSAAAVDLGDYYFRRGDFRAAADAYAKAAAPLHGDDANAAWAAFQHANALVRIRQYDDAAQAYEAIIASQSAWAADAELRLGLLQLERRLRTGRPAEETAK